MKINIYKFSTTLFLLLLGLIALLDVFIPQDHPNRYIPVALQAIVLGFSLLYLFKSQSRYIIKTPLHRFILIFSLMLIIYGIFTPNMKDLPVLLYALIPFYLAYYLSLKGYLETKHIQKLALFLLIVYSYEAYLGIVGRANLYGDFFTKADNVGYNALYLMLIFSMNIKKPRNIILLSASYAIVLLSFKRGAMLIGTIVFIISLWPIITGKIAINKKIKSYLVLLSVFIFIAALYAVIIYWDILTYRFVSDETGSGRDSIWSLIIKGWSDADLISKVFGFGLFSVPDYLGITYGMAFYAHSDWYELLYDHGILGILIYLILIITAISQLKKVRRFANDYYYTYLSSLILWILKSYFSGVYINKGSISLMVILGVILSISNRNKYILNTNFSCRNEKIEKVN